MNFPPSLAPVVLARSFRAANGELGLLPADADAFLDACARDGIAVLGWEFWIVDHAWRGADPVPAPGSWCGLVPTRDGRRAVHGGTGDLAATRTELRGPADVDPRWLPFLRVNVTLDG